MVTPGEAPKAPQRQVCHRCTIHNLVQGRIALPPHRKSHHPDVMCTAMRSIADDREFWITSTTASNVCSHKASGHLPKESARGTLGLLPGRLMPVLVGGAAGA